MADRVWAIERNLEKLLGRTAIDRTDEVHPQNVFLFERIARIIGLDVAGVKRPVEFVVYDDQSDFGKALVTSFTGSPAQLKATWKAYHIYAQIQSGEIDHTPALYVIDQRGRDGVEIDGGVARVAAHAASIGDIPSGSATCRAGRGGRR